MTVTGLGFTVLESLSSALAYASSTLGGTMSAWALLQHALPCRVSTTQTLEEHGCCKGKITN